MTVSSRSLGTSPLEIRAEMARLGEVATSRELAMLGLTRRDVASAIAEGALIRARIGWYVSSAASDEVTRAVRVGGMLACCSAVASYGLPVPDRTRLHVALDPNSSRLRSSVDATAHPVVGSEPDVVLHWRDRLVPHERSRVGLADALRQMAGCAPLEWTVAAIDAARRSTRESPALLGDEALRRLRRSCDARGRHAIDLSVSESESPLESITRMRLADLVDQVTLQHPIGRYRADLLLNGWLVIECDGMLHSHAEQFELDRRRDAYFARFGYRTLRFSGSQILGRWSEEVLPAIRGALALGAPHQSATRYL